MWSTCAILCCHLWPVRLYNIFSTLSHKRHYFRKKKVIEHKSVLIFFTTFVRRIFFLFSEEFSDCYPKCTYVYACMQSTRYSCQMSMKLEFCGHIFENSNIKFRENPCSGSRVPCVRADGRRDRRTWRNYSLFAILLTRVRIVARIAYKRVCNYRSFREGSELLAELRGMLTCSVLWWGTPFARSVRYSRHLPCVLLRRQDCVPGVKQ